MRLKINTFLIRITRVNYIKTNKSRMIRFGMHMIICILTSWFINYLASSHDKFIYDDIIKIISFQYRHFRP